MAYVYDEFRSLVAPLTDAVKKELEDAGLHRLLNPDYVAFTENSEDVVTKREAEKNPRPALTVIPKGPDPKNA